MPIAVERDIKKDPLPFDRLSDIPTRPHTDLTNITSDQHHARSHDHSLAADTIIRFIENIGYGKTVTSTGWTTTPTSLPSSVDEDMTTVTGTGKNSGYTTETENQGEITIDLGGYYPVSWVFIYLVLGSESATVATCRARAGIFNTVSDAQLGSDVSVAGIGSASKVISGHPNTEYVRYINLRIWNASAGANSTLAVKEVLVYSRNIQLV